MRAPPLLRPRQPRNRLFQRTAEAVCHQEARRTLPGRPPKPWRLLRPSGLSGWGFQCGWSADGCLQTHDPPGRKGGTSSLQKPSCPVPSLGRPYCADASGERFGIYPYAGRYLTIKWRAAPASSLTVDFCHGYAEWPGAGRHPGGIVATGRYSSKSSNAAT